MCNRNAVLSGLMDSKKENVCTILTVVDAEALSK